MRSASTALVTLLNGMRTGDATAVVADLFTFTLASGTILTYTNADTSITWNGRTYLGNSVLVDGLKYRCETGLSVDQQQIVLSARSTDTVGGVPFLQALRNGVFDGCGIQRERVFLSAWGTTPVGSVVLFKGRIGTIGKIGRTSAEITVNSELVLLDIEMPRNVYGPSCQHVLYDSGCALVKESFGASGAVGAGSTTTTINWSGADTNYKQGTITFTSGANSGVSVTVKSAAAGVLSLMYPLNNVPATGDAFSVYWGCDHTLATCGTKFNNTINFLGFPYIPSPSVAT